MNRETEIQISAWLDGELAGSQAAAVDRLVATDPAARALATELGHTRAALAAGEPRRRLEDARAFYWSKIERAIAAAEAREPAAAEAPATAPWRRWLRVLAPVGAIAVVALVAAVPAWRGHTRGSTPLLAEVESPLEDMSSFTFHSESEGMTVVWVDSH
jgi:anti-sigma factor RsiW